MSSPWEGGSRTAAASKTSDLVAKLIEGGSHVEARLVATGILDLMTNFTRAESEIGTHPSDILKAFAACAAAGFAGIIDAAGDPEDYDDLSVSCGELVAEMTKASIAKAGGA